MTLTRTIDFDSAAVDCSPRLQVVLPEQWT